MDISRKLGVLGYPNHKKCDVGDEDQFRRLVVWLEDQKIRQLTIDARSGLRDIKSKQWDTCFKSYLTKAGCPLAASSSPAVISWLVGMAVRLEYAESPEKFNDQVEESQSHPESSLDSSVFISGVDSLADKLQIPWHPDPQVRLEALSHLVASRLTKEALAKPSTIIPQGQAFPFRKKTLGVEDEGDEVVSEAVKILRLLYIQDLRKLQTSINECIVEVQKVTANPKTDTRLGKVGR